MASRSDWATGLSGDELDAFAAWHLQDIEERTAPLIAAQLLRQEAERASVDGADPKRWGLRTSGDDMSSVHPRRVRTT